MNEDKPETFQTVFDNFLIFAEKVLKHDISGDLVLDSGSVQCNAIQAQFNRYKALYNKTRTDEGHINLLKRIYNNCRNALLRNDLDKFMDWFSNQRFEIVASKRAQIRLTVIFRNCIRIAESIDEEDAEKDNPAGTYPESFMLHLLRLFMFCADETDKNTFLKKYISELEDTLGLNEGEVPLTSDGFKEVYSAIVNLARESGVDIPDNVKLSGRKISKMLTEITKHEGTKNSVKEIFKDVDIKNGKLGPATLTKIMERMAENAKSMPDPLVRSLNATADTAQSNENTSNVVSTSS